MTTEPSSRKLPKRTPDPAQTLAGAFQGLLSEYISTVNHILPHVGSKAVQEEIIKHTRGVHTEALKVLMEAGEQIEARNKEQSDEG
jgi:hypothetical protein